MTRKNIAKILETLFNNCCYTHKIVYNICNSALEGGYNELVIISDIDAKHCNGSSGIVRVYDTFTTIKVVDYERYTILEQTILNKNIKACGLFGRKFSMLIETKYGQFKLSINCEDKNNIQYKLN